MDRIPAQTVSFLLRRGLDRAFSAAEHVQSRRIGDGRHRVVIDVWPNEADRRWALGLDNLPSVTFLVDLADSPGGGEPFRMDLSQTRASMVVALERAVAERIALEEAVADA